MGFKIISNGKEVLTGGCGSEEIYSTEEEIRIGTWIDGKPIYRRVFKFRTPSSSTDSVGIKIASVPDVYPIKIEGLLATGGTGFIPLGSTSHDRNYGFDIIYQKRSDRNGLYCRINVPANDSWLNSDGFVIFEYTKDADPATINSSQTSSVDLLMPETKSIASTAKEITVIEKETITE